MDQIANELFIDTVTEIENAFRLARLVGFKPTPPIAAKASFSLTLGSLLDVDMVIRTPIAIDVVGNDVPMTFELFAEDENGRPNLDEDIIIPAGNFSNNSIVGVQGITRREEYTSNGSRNQTYTLGESPVIYDSIRVDVDGVRWTQVDYFTDSNPRLEYRVEFNSDYSAYVIFGNNISGAIPPNGSRVRVTYRRGGGTSGNIVSGAIDTSIPFEVPGFDISVPVAITNYTKADFGYNGDSVDDIRRKLPSYLRTQDRAVTGDDYKTLTDQFVTAFNGQIGKSTAVLRNHGCAGNVIDLFVLARNDEDSLQEASDNLKLELYDELNAKKMMTDHVCIKDGVIIAVDVLVEITMDRFFRKFKDEIDVKAQNRIHEFFDLRNWDYGKDLRDTDVIKALSDIREISRVDVSYVTNDADNSGIQVTTRYYEIIRPDNITVSFTFE